MLSFFLRTYMRQQVLSFNKIERTTEEENYKRYVQKNIEKILFSITFNKTFFDDFLEQFLED